MTGNSLGRWWHAAWLACLVALVAACATPTTLNMQWVNPAFAGKPPLGKIIVMGVTRDATNRRVFEDAMVAALTAKGVPAVASYVYLPTDGPAEQAQLQAAVQSAGAGGIILSRVVNVSQTVQVSPGTNMAWGPAWGGPMGWGGFNGFYNGMWASSMSIPPQITVRDNIVADTQLFDARDHSIVWTGSTTTTPGGQSSSAIMQQFAQLIVDSMAAAKVL